MNLSGRKILVTGADGFIGSHLVEELVHDGYDVGAFVQYDSFSSRGRLASETLAVYGSPKAEQGSAGQ